MLSSELYKFKANKVTSEGFRGTIVPITQPGSAPELMAAPRLNLIFAPTHYFRARDWMGFNYHFEVFGMTLSGIELILPGLVERAQPTVKLCRIDQNQIVHFASAVEWKNLEMDCSNIRHVIHKELRKTAENDLYHTSSRTQLNTRRSVSAFTVL